MYVVSRLQTAILALIIAAVACAVTRYYFPRWKVVTVVQEKIVVQKNVHIIRRTVARPDGTRETITERTDLSTSRSEKREETASRPASPNWLVTVAASQRLGDFPTLHPEYTLGLHRRILGPLFAGVTVGRQMVGLSIAMEF